MPPRNLLYPVKTQVLPYSPLLRSTKGGVDLRFSFDYTESAHRQCVRFWTATLTEPDPVPNSQLYSRLYPDLRIGHSLGLELPATIPPSTLSSVVTELSPRIRVFGFSENRTGSCQAELFISCASWRGLFPGSLFRLVGKRRQRPAPH
jgi:hypothetical protein